MVLGVENPPDKCLKVLTWQDDHRLCPAAAAIFLYEGRKRAMPYSSYVQQRKLCNQRHDTQKLRSTLH
jgi:hypothetical protein